MKLASWLEEELGKKVELVCEEQMLGDLTKNQVESKVYFIPLPIRSLKHPGVQ